jgi:predicted DNA-binding WGR domain protein
MPISGNRTLNVVFGTSALNDIYTVGYADSFKYSGNNPSGLGYYEVYTNTTKTDYGILIAPYYETLNFAGKPISNGSLPKNFFTTFLGSDYKYPSFQGSASDEYVVISPYGDYYQSIVTRVIDGGGGVDVAFLAQNSFNISSIKTNSLGIAKAETLDTVTFLLNTESLDTVDKQYALPSSTINYTSSSQQNSESYVLDINDNSVSPGSYSSTYLLPTNGNDFRSFTGNYLWNVDAGLGSDTFLITDRKSADIKTWTYADNTWYLYLGNGNYTFKNLENIIFSDTGFRLNSDGTKSELPFTDLKSSGQVLVVNNGAANFSITGTPAVGQILTAAATSKDPDGDGTFSYQWQSSADGGASWVAIAAANASTYTVASADAAKTIRALISYKDLKGFQESVTATPVAIPIVNNGAASFSIKGTPAVGQILTAAATSKDPDGDGTFSYQWQSSADGGASWVAIAAANASTYTVAAADAAKTIWALISYKDLKGFQESVTAAPVAIPIVNNGAASFSITGTPAVGQILTAAATSKDPDGDGTFSYQWQSSADGGASWAAIAAANASTYTVASAENSKKLRSVISYKDQKGFAEVVTTQPVSISSGAANTPSTTGNNSPATSFSNTNALATASALPFPFFADPKSSGQVLVVNNGAANFSITGTPAVGQILTAAATSKDPDGDGTFSYQWQSSADGGSSWVAIAAANASTYTVAAADAAKTIRALISYKDLKGFQESVTATPVAIPIVNNGVASFSITGTPAVGQILTAAATSKDPDGDGTFSYQWQSSADGGSSWVAIAAANASTYTVASAENSKKLRSVISYKDQKGFAEVVTTQPVSISSGAANTPSTTGNNSPATSVSNGSGTTIVNNITNNITNNTINSNNTTTNNINNSINITGSFNGNTSAQALAGSLKLEDPDTKKALPVNGDSAVKTLAQLTAAKPLSDTAKQLLDRYIIKDPSSSSSRKASASDAGFIDFTLKTGSLKSLTAEIALASEVKASAYVKVNPNTGEAFDFTYDPITGLGAELLDNNKNGLVDSLRIHLQDGAKGDVDGLINGEIRDPGVLADAPRQSVYRFFKAEKGVHLYTSSEAERANVNAHPEWGYKDEGVAYQALVTQGKALHRFFNAKASYHFMTTNDDESKKVIASPEWGFTYEGTSFSVSTIPQLGMSTPVNRFYRVLDGVGQHFYTASADEASNINAHPEWGYKSEGIGWYV